MHKRLVLAAFLFSALAALLVACGGGGDDADSGMTLEVRAEDYRFVPSEVSIPAGQTVTLKLKNGTGQAHDLEVQSLRVQMMGDDEDMDMGEHEGATPGTLAMHTEKGKTASVTFMAEQKGTYEFWCTISGHKEQGMVGKLIVN